MNTSVTRSRVISLITLPAAYKQSDATFYTTNIAVLPHLNDITDPSYRSFTLLISYSPKPSANADGQGKVKDCLTASLAENLLSEGRDTNQ